MLRTPLRPGLVVLSLLLAGDAAAWWSCTWPYRFQVDISNPPGVTFTDYEVRIDLGAGDVPAQFDWGAAGADLRFVAEDDLTELDFFVERWDATGRNAILWVQVPLISGNGTSVYVYFGAAGSTNGSTILTFTRTGTKFHTRNTAADPASRGAAETAFDSAGPNTPGYGCTMVADYTALQNSSTFSPPVRNEDFGLFGEAWFEVGAGQAGSWQFRYGADFGRGGALYVDEVELEAAWNDDLSWANDFSNSAETLSGQITLAPGWHSLRVLGFEDCCDGDQSLEFQAPGDTWLGFSTANLPIVTRQCPQQDEPQIAFTAGEISPCPALTVTRTTTTESDPLNGTTNPKAIPGAAVLNEVGVANSGAGMVDAGTFTVTDAIPANMALSVVDYDGGTSGPVRFADGTPSSGLAFTFGGLGDAFDSVSFSSDGGSTFDYTPTPDANGVDTAVTHIRIAPGGQFLGDAGSGSPSASFFFRTVVQ